ncbi:hypothetical protein I4U23_015296 [Adineta vaga]|nr:hypothetical protein I4U23_015296 [Adineta vaga]
MNMKCSDVQLTDLPDEILQMIFKKLTNIEVLYSLLDVNKRLHSLANDSFFTEHLTFLVHSVNEILPNIHSKIKWLNLEPLSMRDILSATDYPNLHGLTLLHIERETDLCLFADCAFKNLITKLIITMNEYDSSKQRLDLTSIVCDEIFSIFVNLIYLKIQSSHEWYCNTIERLSFDHSSPTFASSTLTELYVTLRDFTDLLYLLDGRLNQLRTLHVMAIYFLVDSSESIRKDELVNLKTFSLTSRSVIFRYEKTLVPLLHRMTHLEKLFLNVCIERETLHGSFIDGNNLKNNIVNYMPRLNKFVFSIHSNVIHSNSLLNIPSNDDIQHTFKDLKDYQVVSYIHYFPKDKMIQCHIYSSPYSMDSLYRLTNSFPGGLLESVHNVYLFDEKPFEHEFFIRIVQAFPYLKTLLIENYSPQNCKECLQSNENDQNFEMIKYPYLNLLILHGSHKDYLEQNLDNNKTCLLNDINLYVHYGTLQTVTHNFIRSLTRINCEKITFINDIRKSNIPEHFHDYFSRIETL